MDRLAEHRGRSRRPSCRLPSMAKARLRSGGRRSGARLPVGPGEHAAAQRPVNVDRPAGHDLGARGHRADDGDVAVVEIDRLAGTNRLSISSDGIGAGAGAGEGADCGLGRFVRNVDWCRAPRRQRWRESGIIQGGIRAEHAHDPYVALRRDRQSARPSSPW